MATIADPRDLMTDLELSELAEVVATRLQDVITTLRSSSPRSP